MELRQKSKKELQNDTSEEGLIKKIPDSDATIKSLTTPYNFSMLVENGAEASTTVDISFKFTKQNFKLEYEDESVETLSLSLPPGR